MMHYINAYLSKVGEKILDQELGGERVVGKTLATHCALLLGVVPGESRPGESRGISKFGLPVPRGKFWPFPGEKRGK